MDDHEESGSDGGSRIARQDEILELLYWLEGEGFAEREATVDGVIRFLAQPRGEVMAALDHLVRRGDVQRDGDALRLTEIGRVEAARRFAAEFAPMLSQGHGECNDPDCDCHTNPAGAAECHALRAHGNH